MADLRIWSNALSSFGNVTDSFEVAGERRQRLVIRTEHGLVYVMMRWHYDKPEDNYIEFETIVEGRIFHGRVEGMYSERYLVTLAKRFAEKAVCSEAPFGCEEANQS